MQKPSTSHVPLAPAYGYVCKRPAFLAVLLSDVGDVFDWYSFTPDVQEERERERERGSSFPKHQSLAKCQFSGTFMSLLLMEMANLPAMASNLYSY